MEDDSPENFSSSSEFNFLLKKNRHEKKKLSIKPKTQNSSADTKSEAETLDDPILTDKNSGATDTDEGSSKDAVIQQARVHDEVFDNVSRISVDSVAKVEPSYEINEIILSFERCLLNSRALPKEAKTYQLESFENKALIIFNQKEIDHHKPRHGTEKDVDALTRTFKNFGFEVTRHNNLTKDCLFEEVKNFSERDFTNYGCVAVAILTHGSNNGMLRAKDQQYSEIEVINHFKDYDKPTLVTKPKIFIIQACRGNKIMAGVPVLHSSKICKDLDEEDLEPYILPLESDLLILHSSYPGRASYRNVDDGSWFIQTLCEKIDTLSSTQDLESIFTEVKRDVAIHKQHKEYNKRTCEMNVNKQMPVMTSTLIRKLYLKKFGERSVEDKSRSQSDSRYADLEVAKNMPSWILILLFGAFPLWAIYRKYVRC